MATSAIRDGVLHLAGDLTLETAGALFRSIQTAWDRTDAPGAVDLSEVERIDSAGLALLLEWQAGARRREQALELRHAPEDLKKLAALCEASELLGLPAQTAIEGASS